MDSYAKIQSFFNGDIKLNFHKNILQAFIIAILTVCIFQTFCFAEENEEEFNPFDHYYAFELSENQIFAFEYNADKKMPKWYYELIVKNPGFTKKQAVAFENAVKNGVEDKRYYRYVVNKNYVRSVRHVDDSGEKVILKTNVFSMLGYIKRHKRDKNISLIIDLNAHEFIRYANELHNDGKSARQKPFLKTTLLTDYILLSKGGELYTSSFKNIVFPQFKRKLFKSKMDILEFVSRLDPKREYFLSFIKAVSYFNLLHEIVPDDIGHQRRLYDYVLEDYAKNPDLVNSAMNLAPLAEGLLFDKDTKIAYKKELIKKIVKYYKKTDGYKKKVLGMILSSISPLMLINSEVSQELIDKIKTEYAKFNQHGKSYPEWFKTDFYKKNKEVYIKQFFYSDKDGIASFNTFVKEALGQGYNDLYMLDKYGNQSALSIKKVDYDYIKRWESSLIMKKEIKGSVLCFELSITQTQDRSLSFRKDLKSQKYVSLIHRGHSYYLNNTFNNYKTTIPYKKLLGLGSCGGYNEVAGIYESTSKNADFFATQGMGTMRINNPLIIAIFENIVSSKGQMSWFDISKNLQRIYDSDTRGKDYFDPSHIGMRILNLKD